MRIRSAMASLLALLLGVGASAADYVPGEIIVKYKSGVHRTQSAVSSLYDAAGADSIRYFSDNLGNLEQWVLGRGVSMKEALEAARKSPLVEYAQPNYILSLPSAVNATQVARLSDDPPPGSGIPCIPGFEIPGCDEGGGGGGGDVPCLIPGLPFPPGCKDDGGTPPFPDPGNPGQPPANRPPVADAPAEVIPPVADPDNSKAWGLAKIGAPDAWNDHRGTKEFVVAVIDTGIDYNHKDLSFNVWRNPNPTREDVVGFDFIHNDGLPFDDQGHGTHTAGTVGAAGGDGQGISGVSQKISIMGLKFLSSEGSGTTADAIRAIDYAVENGARVLSNSWGGRGDQDNQALSDSVERARQKGVLFIAAAGNDGVDNTGPQRSYPAAFSHDNLISVAATDQNDRIAFFSNYGSNVHLAAPGVNVYSTIPGNRYQQNSGTSMACPHVAGAAALIWSRNPDLTYKQVRDVLLNTVEPVAGLNGKVATGGRLNVLKALRSTE